MAPRTSPQARALLSRQRGAIAAWQAAEVGLSRRALVRASHEEWMRVGHHVFVDRAGDLTPAQMRMIGVLEAGPGAVLAGTSALIEAGWTGTSDGHVDVLCDRRHRGRDRHALPWLRMRLPHELPPRTGTPARTGSARAAIDAASWARTPREALMILTSAAQQRIVTPAQLRRELGTRRRARNRKVIQEILDELVTGATSVNEAEFLRQCRRRGLPKPRMQTSRRGSSGGVRRTDAEFVLPDGRLLIVEIDGIGHLDASTWQADMTRHNDLTTSTGALFLRVTGWAVRNDPDEFFDLLTSLLLDGVRIPTGRWSDT